MIFVHTNHATKGGSPEVVLVAKASDTDIIFIDWSTSAENSFGQGQHWRWIPVHELCVSIGPQKRRGIHTFTNQGICVCLPSATSIRRCDVCDDLTDVFHKLSKFPSTVTDDDMEILVRFVSECMTDPTQLRASMMQDWRCLQGCVIRRASYGVVQSTVF